MNYASDIVLASGNISFVPKELDFLPAVPYL